MKNILNYIMPFCLILTICVGCSKEEVMPKNENYLDALLSLRSDEEIPADIYISMVANGQGFTSEIGTVEVNASFKNPSGSYANVNDLHVGGIEIPQDGSTGFYRKVFGFDLSNRSDLSTALALYGTNIEYEVDGSSPMPTMIEDFYLPEIVNFIVYDHGDGEIDPTQNLTVTWNMDSSNEKVSIGLFFIPRNNELVSPITKVYQTDDDGSFTIPSTDLQNFPAGYGINIGIARGHVEDIEISPTYIARLAAVTYSITDVFVEEP